MSSLQNKVAIITGSTSGIGESIAGMLTYAGAHVVVNSVSSVEKGNKLTQELDHSIYIQGDIGIESDCKRIINVTVNHLTKFLAKHCCPEMRANAIAPGLIVTPRTGNFDEAVTKFKNQTPLKRTGEPSDIAELVIAINKSNYINGEVILADGGFSTM